MSPKLYLVLVLLALGAYRRLGRRWNYPHSR